MRYNCLNYLAVKMQFPYLCLCAVSVTQSEEISHFYISNWNCCNFPWGSSVHIGGFSWLQLSISYVGISIWKWLSGISDILERTISKYTISLNESKYCQKLMSIFCSYLQIQHKFCGQLLFFLCEISKKFTIFE